MKTSKKRASKVAHNRPRPFFSQSSPAHSPQSRIDYSYYKYVPRHICLLICGETQKEKKNMGCTIYKGGEKKPFEVATSFRVTLPYLILSVHTCVFSGLRM